MEFKSHMTCMLFYVNIRHLTKSKFLFFSIIDVNGFKMNVIVCKECSQGFSHFIQKVYSLYLKTSLLCSLDILVGTLKSAQSIPLFSIGLFSVLYFLPDRLGKNSITKFSTKHLKHLFEYLNQINIILLGV